MSISGWQPIGNVSKDDLERRKLEVEIDEVVARTSEIGSLRNKVALWSGLVAIAVSLWGLEHSILSYIDQRERALEINISREMIDLSFKLSSGDENERAQAALLLSAFEEYAVPVLASSLRTADSSELQSKIIDSLEIILQKRRVRDIPEKVFEPLRMYATRAVAEESAKASPSLVVIDNYIESMARLAKGSGDRDVIATLGELKKIIASDVSSIVGENRQTLNDRVDSAIELVSNRRRPGSTIK